MLNIFILEDDFIQQTRIERAVREGAKKNAIPYRRLEVFGKPEQLLSAIKEKGSHQIFFLDIEIKREQKKGLDIARVIRENDPYAIIVFVSTHSEFLPITYRYRGFALDFIDKGLSEDEFNQAIVDVLTYTPTHATHANFDKPFTYKTEKAHVLVPFDEVLYLETAPTVHKVILKTKTGQVEFYGKVSEIAKRDDRLYQAHRSCVINPKNVVKIDRTNHIAYFGNGESCFISRLKQKKLIEIIEKKI